MEIQIHSLEQEAYASVLRAFKAQSDAITWEKEGLITELRKELRVSDDEHREILSRVNNDETIRRIREWRQTGGHQASMLGTSHDLLPSPTVSMSRKKQKTSQSVPHLSVMPSAKSMQYGSGPATSRSFNNRSAVFTANVSAEADKLIGKKVWTRWPDDNFFYEAVITDYNPLEGRHALVYDINTPNETWEWVDLKEISPEDIRWDEDPASVSNRRIRGTKRPLDRSGSARGRAPPMRSQQPRRETTFPSQNGAAKKLKPTDDIELFNTDSLVKEVQRVFDANILDPVEIAKAKKMLKDHELALVEAISRLGDDGESGNLLTHNIYTAAFPVLGPRPTQKHSSLISTILYFSTVDKITNLVWFYVK